MMVGISPSSPGFQPLICEQSHHVGAALERVCRQRMSSLRQGLAQNQIARHYRTDDSGGIAERLAAQIKRR
jgi:hypothetical protein